MAARNLKPTPTVAVPLNHFNHLREDLCDIGSFIGLALRYFNGANQLDYDETLAVRTLLLEGKKRLELHHEPLDKLAAS